MSKSFSHLIEEYILSKKLAWAQSSIKNEHARLKCHAVNIHEDPFKVYEVLSKRMKPYSIKTTFVRLGEFYQWLMDNDKIPLAKNPWKLFMDSHANLFKHAYQPERLTVTFEEAKRRIQEMPDSNLRMAAMQLLTAGLRSCELSTFDGEQVIGKGGKPRAVFLNEFPELREYRFTGKYQQLYKALKQVGLKPHTLRKLCATEFSSQPGVTDIDTMEVFGWNDISTSAKYRQPKRREVLGGLLKKAVGK